MIEVYDQEKHFGSINKWLTDRDMPPLPDWSIPPSGFVIPDIACGFVIMGNNFTGILDFYISNPHAQGRDVDRGIDFITNELIEFAKQVGLKMLVCSSKISSIQSRALKHGFKKDGDFASFTRGL